MAPRLAKFLSKYLGIYLGIYFANMAPTAHHKAAVVAEVPATQGAATADPAVEIVAFVVAFNRSNTSSTSNNRSSSSNVSPRLVYKIPR